MYEWWAPGAAGDLAWQVDWRGRWRPVISCSLTQCLTQPGRTLHNTCWHSRWPCAFMSYTLPSGCTRKVTRFLYYAPAAASMSHLCPAQYLSEDLLRTHLSRLQLTIMFICIYLHVFCSRKHLLYACRSNDRIPLKSKEPLNQTFKYFYGKCSYHLIDITEDHDLFAHLISQTFR